MNAALRYLEKVEWSMGIRQCPECGGTDPYTVRAIWNHPHGTVIRELKRNYGAGHKDDCLLNLAIEELHDE